MTTDAKPPKDVGPLLEFLYRLGQAYLACGEQTANVELMLRRVAAQQGARRVRIVAFPTALFITLHDGEQERVTLAEGPTQTLRLDQIADVYVLGDAAQKGQMTPAHGLDQLAAILRTKARFGVIGQVLGHTILAVGLMMSLEASTASLVAAAVLGLVVGVLKALNRDRPVLAVPMPVAAAALVSALIYAAINRGVTLDPTHTLVPPLVTFLPGAMLTLGMVELAYGDMVSGSSRLVTGLIQLVLLAFGLAVGAALVGVSPDKLLEAADEVRPSWWVPWVAVAVFGVGAYLHFSAPRRSLRWMLLVLFIAFGAQQIAEAAIGPKVGGFFGMMVATPVGYLIQLRFKGPPAMVTFLPSFWLLVPGTLGLMSVTRMMSDRAAGLDGLSQATFGFASLAVGTLVGASLYKWITETFGWWQLQIGRVSRFIRRRGGRGPTS